MKTKIDAKTFLFLHAVILVYALGTVFSKLAASAAPFSFPFFGYYALFIGCLGVYALAWQQVLKRVPLVTAFCNKAVTVVWGMLLGALIFKEQIGVMNVVGAAVVIVGVVMVVSADD